MVSLTFRNLLKQPGARLATDQKNSADWFRNLALQVNKVNTDQLINTSEPFKRIVKISETSIGKMYMFTYDPKLKTKLPYYDIYPLIFPIEYYNDGFLGLNFHYLPPLARAALMDSLYELINNDKQNKTTKLQISYKILKNAAQAEYIKPCIKRYLFNHVKSNFLYIAPDEWNIALMLPTQKFVRTTSSGTESQVSTATVYKGLTRI